MSGVSSLLSIELAAILFVFRGVGNSTCLWTTTKEWMAEKVATRPERVDYNVEMSTWRVLYVDFHTVEDSSGWVATEEETISSRDEDLQKEKEK